jgi:hypothetical protein
MIAVKDLAGTVSFAVIFGLFSGACIALTPAMLGQRPTLLTPPRCILIILDLTVHLANDANEFGTRLGLYFGLGGVS